MSDLIDRQAAIDALEKEKTYCSAYADGYTHTDYFKQYNMGLTDGIKALKKLPSAQPEQKWIPCSERLPEKHGEMYLVTISDGSVYSFALQWDINRKRWYLSFLNNGEIYIDYIDDVIAWMPLPEPYKEDVEAMPTIHPERKKGKWEQVSVSYMSEMDEESREVIAIVSMFCPQCNRYHNEVYIYGNPTYGVNFCPNCGADMRGDTE